VIEWTGTHPARGLPDRGCTLTRLEVFHPWPLALAQLLRSIGLRNAVMLRTLPDGDRPYLKAYIETPLGPRILGGPRV